MKTLGDCIDREWFAMAGRRPELQDEYDAGRAEALAARQQAEQRAQAERQRRIERRERRRRKGTGTTRRKSRRQTKDDTALRFAALLRTAGLPAPTPEYAFHHSRKWRFDYAWPAVNVALEVQGGQYNFFASQKKIKTLLGYLRKGSPNRGGIISQIEALVSQMVGRHGRGDHLKNEYDKLNEAALDGWRVYFVMPDQLLSDATVELVRSALYEGGERAEIDAWFCAQEA